MEITIKLLVLALEELMRRQGLFVGNVWGNFMTYEDQKILEGSYFQRTRNFNVCQE